MASAKPKVAGKKPTGAAYKSKTFSESSDDDVLGMAFNMHGVPTSGKTFAALAASKQWPKDLEAHKKRGKTTFLEDVCYVGWDKKGPVGILPFKLKLRHQVDMRALVYERKDLADAMEQVCDDMQELLHNNSDIKVVIHDTVTRMDSMIEAYCFHPDNAEWTTRGGDEEIDGRRTYGKVARLHHEYQSAMTTTPADVTSIFLFHQKVLEEVPSGGKASQREIARQKQMMIKMGDQYVRVVPAITGKSMNVYTADCSMEFVCVKAGAKRFLYPEIHDGQRAKNRLEDVFKGPQEAHMGKIIEKARRACK